MNELAVGSGVWGRSILHLATEEPIVELRERGIGTKLLSIRKVTSGRSTNQQRQVHLMQISQS